MRFSPTCIGLSLFAATTACNAAQGESPDARPVRRASAEVADPMAPFARMVPGAWKMALSSGATSFTTWRWGPGRHSIRGGELELYYWHPGRKEVRVLSLHADIPGIGRGSGEGTMLFEGDTAVGFVDVQQPRDLRELGVRWTFNGPDEYHDELLEKNGPEGYQPLAAWTFVRVQSPPEALAPGAEAGRKPAEPLGMFDTLVGGTWEASGTRSSFEAIPDYVYARVLAPSEHGEPTHLLDANFYQQVGTGVLRCLALSNRGAVYEGVLTVLDGGALQLDLQGYEGDQVVPYVVRIDFEQDGAVRNRVWSLEGAERTLRVDARHRRP